MGPATSTTPQDASPHSVITTLLSRMQRLWMSIVRFFTGHDVFISYSREDGRWYATELANHLASLRFACLFDCWWTTPGKTIPLRLKLGIRRSSLAVVVVTPMSPISQHVAEEINEFLPTGRTLVLIDIGGSISQAVWRTAVEGLPPETERILITPENRAELRTARPSPDVLNRL